MEFKHCVLISVLLAGCSLVPSGGNDGIIDSFEDSFVKYMASDWEKYQVTEYIDKSAPDYGYIVDGFGDKVLAMSEAVYSKKLNIQEFGDSEGGYDLGIIEFRYPSEEKSLEAYELISNSTTKNLTGGKVFTGYIPKRCGSSVLVLYSRAVLTEKIKGYFGKVKNSPCVE